MYGRYQLVYLSTALLILVSALIVVKSLVKLIEGNQVHHSVY